VVDDALKTEVPPGPTSPVTVVAGIGERGRPAADGAHVVGPQRQQLVVQRRQQIGLLGRRGEQGVLGGCDRPAAVPRGG
jgi:hypothetical protein